MIHEQGRVSKPNWKYSLPLVSGSVAKSIWFKKKKCWFLQQIHTCSRKNNWDITSTFVSSVCFVGIMHREAPFWDSRGRGQWVMVCQVYGCKHHLHDFSQTLSICTGSSALTSPVTEQNWFPLLFWILLFPPSGFDMWTRRGTYAQGDGALWKVQTWEESGPGREREQNKKSKQTKRESEAEQETGKKGKVEKQRKRGRRKRGLLNPWPFGLSKCYTQLNIRCSVLPPWSEGEFPKVSLHQLAS